MALSYKEGKRVFLKTILILGAITITEVAFALYGKGHLVEGHSLPSSLIGSVMIVMSVVKAYFIIFEFMHMKYEAKGLMRSVLLPGLLLVWGVIAFLWDGNYWMGRRNADSTQVEMKVPTIENHEVEHAHDEPHGEDDQHHDDHKNDHD